jgi:hypothetical protein
MSTATKGAVTRAECAALHAFALQKKLGRAIEQSNEFPLLP